MCPLPLFVDCFLLLVSVKHIMIVTEYMENGALDTYLKVTQTPSLLAS